MDEKQLQQLAHEIANQTAFHNWEYWITLLAVALIAALGSYFGAYFAKRGEHAANKADLSKILEQVELTTRMTAGIESVVSLGEWSERERRTLRRVKLEELMVTAHRARDWMAREQNRLFFLIGDEKETVSPLPLVVTLGKLFFPELRVQISAYNTACDALLIFFMQTNQEQMTAKMEAVRSTSTANPQGWEPYAEVEAAQAQIAIRNRSNDEFQRGNRAIYIALTDLDEAAATLMAEIIASPKPS